MGGVDGRVRNIAEKRLVFVPFDEVDGGISDRVCNYCLAERIGDMSNRLVSYNPGQGRVVAFRVSSDPHVVGVRDSLVFVESLGKGHEFGLVSKVPFTKATSCIASFFKDFGNGDFHWIQTSRVSWEHHPSPHSDAIGVASGQKSGPRWGAGGRVDVKVSQFHAFLGHLVQIWRWMNRAKWTNVTIPHVVGEYDHDIWFWIWPGKT